jgi:1-phosphatidylinositol-3-phosphate 5-kinase
LCNRSDDEDDEYNGFRSESKTIHCQKDDYYTLVDFHSGHKPCQTDQIPVDSSTDQKLPFSPVHAESTVFTSSVNSDQTGESQEYSLDECSTTHSALYGIEHIEENTVDIENNRLLWVPPEPDDGEEEGEVLLEDEDDMGPAGEEWRYMRTNSFGGLFPSRYILELTDLIISHVTKYVSSSSSLCWMKLE